jgi:hypothetical protein
MSGVRADGENPHPLAVGDHGRPFGVTGRCQRCLGELEIFGPIVVHDQQPIARRLNVVLNPLESWRDDAWLTLGIVGTD